jgi:hypothetical protein
MLEESNKTNYVDLLEEDKPIGGQKFVCVSFISPEKILQKKELFIFHQFLKKWDFTRSMDNYSHFLNFLSFKYQLNFENITKDFNEFVKEEKDSFTFNSLDDDYKNFMDLNGDNLEEQYLKQNDFQTTTRGLKVRGVFPSLEEAELRCKILRELDPNHDVFVGPVGLWMPWHPEAYKTGRVEYLEEDLNKLMSEKTKNEEAAKNAFEERLKETKRNAIAKNMEDAKRSGNVLTQTIDNNGNLISANDINSQESALKLSNSLSATDIHKELFEGDDIIIA